MPSYRDVVPGQVYGQCIVLQTGFVKYYTNGKWAWACLVRCACGREFTTVVYHLLYGATHSCGCTSRDRARASAWKRQTHGESGEPLYEKWIAIRMRCQNPRNSHYASYGGRGITICEAWDTSYETFRAWALTHGYAPGLTIERLDVNGHYTPENCCFIPPAQQAVNRRNNRLVACWGETKPLAEWLRDPRCAVTEESTLRQRLTRGWPPEQALTTPPNHTHVTNGNLLSCWNETKNMAAWARDPRCVVSYIALKQRIYAGWPTEQALTLPSSNGHGRLHRATPPGQR